MKTFIRKLAGIALFSLALAGSSTFAQPALPPLPPGIQTAWFRFDDTNNWTGPGTNAPLSFSNIVGVPSWQSNALWMDSDSPAWLSYPVVEPSGQVIFVCTNGTLSAWVWPDWSSANLSGTGPGTWAPVINAGFWTSNAEAGWIGLAFAPDGNSLVWAGQNGGYGADFATAPISWDNSGFHLVSVTWSPTNSAIYLDGQLASTNGAGVTYYPGPDALANGLFVGSDSGTGMQQVRAVMDSLRIWNYPLDADTISNQYQNASPLVWPLAASAAGGGFSGADSGPSFPGFGGGGGDGGGDMPDYIPYTFDTNGLWLQSLQIGTNAYNTDPNSATLILHGTTNDDLTTYQLLSTTNLVAPAWTVVQTFLGSVGQNWTPLAIPMGGRPTVFFRARNSSLDSDGDGLPDYWEILYGLDPNNPDTGNTGISDGYKLDSIGDGYTYLQKYQMGVPPNAWVTPNGPFGVTARLDASGTVATISWQLSSGPVIGYTVERIDYVSVEPTFFNVGLTNEFVDTTYPVYDGSIFPTLPSWYDVTANYTNGASSWGGSADVHPYNDQPAAQAVSQAGGPTTIEVSDTPAGVTTLRVTLQDGDGGAVLTNFNVPVTSLTNGSLTLPTSAVPLDPNGISWYVQGVLANGEMSWADNAGFTLPWIWDGHAQLEQNASFVLRAGSLTAPFAYAIDATPVTQPAGYVYVGYSVDPDILDPPTSIDPFDVNYRFRNFVFSDTNVDSSGYLNTGASGAGVGEIGLETPLTFAFALPTTTNSIPTMLDPSETTWMVPYSDPTQLGIQQSGTNYFLPSDIFNYYGLHLDSVMLAYATNGSTQFAQLDSGSQVPIPPGTCYFYPDFDQPQFQTVGFYFSHNDQPGDVLPGSATFSPTNIPVPLVAGVGQKVQITAFAKQIVVNGDHSKYVYVQQYFDKAFKADSNGNATTTQTGVLSPDGTFLATEVGPVVLTTKPDGATGETASCLVNVIKMVLDVNHDGVMDLSFSGPDNTSLAREFPFWLNNNFDRISYDSDDQTNYDDDVLVAGWPGNPSQIVPDFAYAAYVPFQEPVPQIPCERDLQDYTRLWCVGVSNALASLPPGCTTKMYLDVGNYGIPSINIFKAADVNGSNQYLLDPTVASAQTNLAICPFIGTLALSLTGPKPSNVLQFGNAQSANPWPGDYFIFCGAVAGDARLTVDICDPNGVVLAETYQYILIEDIKLMYERWTVGDSPALPPATNAYLAQDSLPADPSSVFPPEPFHYPTPTGTNTPYILLVHGWNDPVWVKDRFAETAFKRFYWQGYQGRFGSFRWPTDYDFNGTLIDAILQPHNYDGSEYAAWQSAAGLLNLLTNVGAQYPGHVYLLAHSMGNVVAGEALRLGAQQGLGQVANTYVASQAAIPAHVYDATVTSPYLIDYTLVAHGLPAPGHPLTPNIYGNRLTNNIAAVGHRISFYNVNDYALKASAWCWDQEQKPDTFVDGHYYYTGGTNDPAPWNNFEFVWFTGGSPRTLDIVNNLTNKYEVLAYAANPYSTALGATPDVGNLTRTVDLTRTTSPEIWPSPDPLNNSYKSHYWHSAEFRGDYWQQQGYWSELLGSEGFGLK